MAKPTLLVSVVEKTQFPDGYGKRVCSVTLFPNTVEGEFTSEFTGGYAVREVRIPPSSWRAKFARQTDGWAVRCCYRQRQP